DESTKPAKTFATCKSLSVTSPKSWAASTPSVITQKEKGQWANGVRSKYESNGRTSPCALGIITSTKVEQMRPRRLLVVQKRTSNVSLRRFYKRSLLSVS